MIPFLQLTEVSSFLLVHMGCAAAKQIFFLGSYRTDGGGKHMKICDPFICGSADPSCGYWIQSYYIHHDIHVCGTVQVIIIPTIPKWASREQRGKLENGDLIF